MNPPTFAYAVTVSGALPAIGDTLKPYEFAGEVVIPQRILSFWIDRGPIVPIACTPSELCHFATALAVEGPKKPVADALR